LSSLSNIMAESVCFTFTKNFALFLTIIRDL
jgi:hypothetical protein